MLENEKTVIGLGEFLIRFTAERGTLIREARNYVANYGGSEANVIISLCHLGHKGRYITRVSDDELGLGAIDYLKTQDVDTSFIQSRGEHPLGTSIVEEGEGARPSVVIYNRKWSSAAQMKPEDFDFKEIMKDGKIFHVSGITLAISTKARETAIAAMKEAKSQGLLVSFDFNYRSKLMSLDEAKKVYPLIAPYIDIVSASSWDLQALLGFHPEEKDLDKLFMDACRELGTVTSSPGRERSFPPEDRSFRPLPIRRTKRSSERNIPSKSSTVSVPGMPLLPDTSMGFSRMKTIWRRLSATESATAFLNRRSWVTVQGSPSRTLKDSF